LHRENLNKPNRENKKENKKNEKTNEKNKKNRLKIIVLACIASAVLLNIAAIGFAGTTGSETGETAQVTANPVSPTNSGNQMRQQTRQAEQTEQDNAANITIVLPRPTPSPTPTAPPTPVPTPTPVPVAPPEPSPTPVIPSPSPLPEVFPSRIDEFEENGRRTIILTYLLEDEENPESIPRTGFIVDGFEYSLFNIMRNSQTDLESIEYTKTIEIQTSTQDINIIMGLIDEKIEHTTEDGFSGTLHLDWRSIQSEAAGTRTDSFNVSATRTYPNLSSVDTSLIPREITDNGRTLTLSDVQWKTSDTEVVNYTQISSRHTATATYTGRGSRTVTTGFITTAEYTGLLNKVNAGQPVYTAVFYGVELPGASETAEMPETSEARQTPETETPETPEVLQTQSEYEPEDEEAQASQLPQASQTEASETESETESKTPSANPASQDERQEERDKGDGSEENENKAGWSFVRLIIPIIAAMGLVGGLIFVIFVSRRKS